MTAPTLTAEPGRRLLFTGFASTTTPWPGVITGIDGDVLLIRLDGMRSTLRIGPFPEPPAWKRLELLDEIGPVPELPMGPFTPTAELLKVEVYDGVPVFELEEGDLFLVTADRDAAVGAMAGFANDHDWYLPDLTGDRLKAQWSVFEWQPEDAEYAWFMNPANEGDDHAVLVHYLPS